jgi:hypothetical protein
MTWVVLRRALGLETSSCGGFTGWFMGPQISGFGDIHHGAGGGSVRIITVCTVWNFSSIPSTA